MSIDTLVFSDLKYITDQGGNNVSIKFTCNGQKEMSVSADAVSNKHYDEITLEEVNFSPYSLMR